VLNLGKINDFKDFFAKRIFKQAVNSYSNIGRNKICHRTVTNATNLTYPK